MVWCLLFLFLAEYGLRWSERQLVPEGGLPTNRPLYIALGTSRTMRSIVPTFATESLVSQGIEDPWVANVSDLGLTMVGLYQNYVQQIRPRLSSSANTAILAIEVRGSGLNDSHLEDREQLFVHQEQFNLDGPGPLPRPSMFDFEALAQGLTSQLALSRAGEILDRWREPGDLDTARWMEGAGGWAPFTRPSSRDLDAGRNRPRYQELLLADYTVGGVQTTYLRRLVHEAQADGWTVVLYVPPVTRMQRTFWKADDLTRYRAHLEAFALEQGLPLFDFDEGHDFKRAEFFDTHHLNRPGARRFTDLWAEAIGKVTSGSE
jgi:hypothetical protein